VIDRRTFLAGAGVVLLAAPLTADAQQAGKVWRIGYLGNGNPTSGGPTRDAFRQRLQELGWVEGQNIVIEYRWADGDLTRFPALASDLVATTPIDVFLAAGAPGVRAAQQAARAVPIVAAIMSDPVVGGFAASLARPGGNITGLAVQFEELATKQLQLLKETVPNLARVAILDDHSVRNTFVQKAAEVAARSLGLTTQVITIRGERDLEGAFQTAKAGRANAMYVLPSPTFARHRARLTELAVKHRLPGSYEDRQYVDAGGLMSYGPNFPDLFRRSASYVDRILKGAKPGELPVEQATKFEFVINLKTAKALGLAIPPSLLGRADEIIQ
jgi:putative ABC transport system substrate-binding protein